MATKFKYVDKKTLPVSDKQREYIRSLRAAAYELPHMKDWQQEFADALIRLLAPEPTNQVEASEFIDGMKIGGLNWARGHREWAEPIMHKMGTELGAKLENVTKPGERWTVETWRAAVDGALAKIR